MVDMLWPECQLLSQYLDVSAKSCVRLAIDLQNKVGLRA